MYAVCDWSSCRAPIHTILRQLKSRTFKCFSSDRGIVEKFVQLCACSIERDKDKGRGVKTLLFKDSPSDSDGTFSLSFHGQAASGVDFVRADTEEHDYTQLTAL